MTRGSCNVGLNLVRQFLIDESSQPLLIFSKLVFKLCEKLSLILFFGLLSLFLLLDSILGFSINVSFLQFVLFELCIFSFILLFGLLFDSECFA